MNEIRLEHWRMWPKKLHSYFLGEYKGLYFNLESLEYNLTLVDDVNFKYLCIEVTNGLR